MRLVILPEDALPASEFLPEEAQLDAAWEAFQHLLALHDRKAIISPNGRH